MNRRDYGLDNEGCRYSPYMRRENYDIHQQSIAWPSPVHRTFPQISGMNQRYMMSQGDDSADTDSKRKPRTYKRVVDKFAENTSMVGVSYIHNSSSWWSKSAWVLLLMGGMAAMGVHLHSLCSTYYAWPKQTTVQLGFSSLEFPAVTICNINPIKKSRLKLAHERLQKLMESVDPDKLVDDIKKKQDKENPPSTKSPSTTPGKTNGRGTTLATKATFPPSFTGKPLTGTTTPLQNKTTSRPGKRRQKRFVKGLTFNVSDPYEDIERDEDKTRWQRESKQSNHAQLDRVYKDLFSKEKTETKRRMGHSVKDMVISCSFNGRECVPKNFTLTTHAIYGNCHTLQYKDFVTSRSGPKEGLELTLYLETEEYLRGWTHGIGAQLLVHQQNTFPLIEEDGIAISAGTETFVALKMLNVQRLSKPHGDCDDGITFKKRYGRIYNRQTCQKFCEQLLIDKHCGCLDPRQDEIVRAVKAENYTACRNNTEMKCLLHIKRQYERSNLTCNCKDPCGETKYIKSISSRLWPSAEYGRVLVQEMCGKKDKDVCEDLAKQDGFRLSQNFIQLNIYYEDLNYENITEEPSYQQDQFLSDVGGTLGLWIGLSVLSVFELGQFFLEMFYIFCGACCARSARVSRKGTSQKERAAPRELTTAGHISDNKMNDWSKSYYSNH